MTPTARNRSLLLLLALVAVVLTQRVGQPPAALAQAYTPPPFPGITLTPTPDIRVVNEITHPEDGDVIAGFTPIVGSALIDDFIQYEVHLSPAGLENWGWLKSSGNLVRNGILAVVNTYTLADGFYDVRVRALRRDGNYSESFVRGLEVRNANPPTATPVFDASGVQQPSSPLLFVSPLSSPTVTPTPRYRSYVPNGQGIFEPKNGAIVRGLVEIVGTANGKTVFNPFQRYELHLSPSSLNEWTWLYTGEQQLWQSPLYTWDTHQVADGLYDLRLRIVYSDSNYDEYYVTRLRVANLSAPPAASAAIDAATGAGTTVAAKEPGIYLPLDDTQIVGVIDLIGTTATPGLLRWEIAYAPADTEAWQFLYGDTKAVTDDLLVRLDLSALPLGAYDFRLRIVREDYSYVDDFLRNIRSIPPTPTPIPRVPA